MGKSWFSYVLRCRRCGGLTDVYPRQNILHDPSNLRDIFVVDQFIFCPKCESSTWNDLIEVCVPSKGVVKRPGSLAILVHSSGYETK